MPDIKPATVAQVAPKAPKGKSKKKTSASKKSDTSAARARVGAASIRSIPGAAVVAGEILGAGAAWSAASAYRASQGADLRLGKMVDVRLIAGVGGIVAGLWKPGTKWASHAVYLGLGTLGSWAHEYSFEAAAKWSKPAGAAAPTSEGVVIGQIDNGGDEAGLFSRRKRLAKIERRLEHLRRRKSRLEGKVASRGRLADYGDYEEAPRRGHRGSPQMVEVPLWAVRPQYRQQMA